MRALLEIILPRPGARLARVLTALLLSLSVPAGHALAQPSNDVREEVRDEPVQAEARNVLSQYGRFVQHARFGEVWVPTVTPQGWHPYPP